MARALPDPSASSTLHVLIYRLTLGLRSEAHS